MPFQRLRRAALAAACSVAALVSACGGGQLVSAFSPTRMVVFGDATADAGQVGGARYTVNSSAINWTERVATRYSLTIAPSSTGGTSYAQGSARVSARPDAAGNATVPSVTEQIDTFLAGSGPASGDLILLGAGVGDIVYEMSRVTAGTITSGQAQANVEQAGRELGAQVRRLVSSGAAHVAVSGAYNLGRSPWAAATGQAALLETLTSRFNETMLISIVDLGAKVLYIDAALQLNLMSSNPGQYSLADVSSVPCTSVDPGPGIGIGAGQVNSALCTSATIAGGIDYTTALWADAVYLSPQAQLSFGENAYTRLRQRW